ncbi:peptide ABC transporter substrate-binding protein [Enterococcus sp. UD-01]|jgi:oligopeptide transport system substrate-binding protein|uniref:peptide ABC transporter substrate-binding protein n=1 Tax=Enterococcus sp. UD-01 TaxID=3373911 RepID=UPI0038395109
MTMKKWLTTTVAAGALMLTLAACSTGSKKDESTGDKKQVLKVLESAELPTMDLSQATDVVSFSAISQVMEGLYEFADDSTSAPAIAKEVATPTDDGKKYTIELRDDAKWSNGDPVTANDFVYSWKRTADPKTGSEYAYLFDGFKNYSAISKGEKPASELGVKAVDDYTLEIDLEYPIPYLSSLLAKPTFYPLNEKYVEEKGKEYGTSSDNMIYNGPFTLEDWDGTSITWKYVKNDKYRDAKNVKLDEVNVQVSKEIGTNVNLFKGGETDIAPIKGEYVDQEKENPELVIRTYPSTSYLQYNTENQIFANKNARNAITKLIDSDQIAKNILKDGSKAINAFVPKGISNQDTGKDFAEEAGALMKTDVEGGKKLWEQAKKELGIDSASITLLTSDTDSAKKLSEYIQGLLTENLSGLKVTISSVPFKNRLDQMSKGDFDVVLAGWAATYADPYDFLQLLRSDGEQNYGKFKNEEYDKLLNDSATTYATDNEKRWNTLLDAQKVFMENSPVTPLYQSSEAFLVNDRVEGLVYRALGAPYYKNVSVK